MGRSEEQSSERGSMTPVPRVDCYSGYRVNERPRVIHLDQKTLTVLEIKDRWYGPDHSYFKVLADDGKTYMLRYDFKSDQWAIKPWDLSPNAQDMDS